MTRVWMKTDATARKVMGAVMGAGGAGAIATIVIFVIQSPRLFDFPVPGDVAAAITTILTAVASYHAGYNTSPAEADQVFPDPAAGIPPVRGQHPVG